MLVYVRRMWRVISPNNLNTHNEEDNALQHDNHQTNTNHYNSTHDYEASSTTGAISIHNTPNTSANTSANNSASTSPNLTGIYGSPNLNFTFTFSESNSPSAQIIDTSGYLSCHTSVCHSNNIIVFGGLHKVCNILYIYLS